ncbi:uncharacterized protein LOC107846206 [Capsicum annuum]|uniref:uncharacterized protein LOC107846206 n=1 Tax=Capsicum annuum TaxID=4072 RepID=UPI001FB17533|nr:uncharacterized protein LOC107846206 [Capsicum annuum]
MKIDFTWVQSSHPLWNSQISVAALKTATWDDSIDRLALYFDYEPIFILESEGARWNSKTVRKTSIKRISITNEVVIDIENVFLNYSQDCQTYRKDRVSRVKVGALMPIMGGDKKFAASGLFDADCSITNFKQMENKLTFPKLC